MIETIRRILIKNIVYKKPIAWATKKIVWIIVALMFLMVSYHQCSNIDLIGRPSVLFFQGQGFHHQISPPVIDSEINYHIILVDMSNSMISGPCPFDANNPTFETHIYYRYDPNKPGTIYSDPNDGRGVARDCWVDPNLERKSGAESAPNLPISQDGLISAGYSTYLGVDPKAHRLTVIDKWVTDLEQNSTPQELANNNILIYPISGGYYQPRLMAEFATDIKFYNTATEGEDLHRAIEKLRTIQTENLTIVKDQDDVMRWKKTSMGTSAYGDAIKKMEPILRASVEDLTRKGTIFQANYNMHIIGDGRQTPTKKIIEDIVGIYDGCQVCKANPSSCKTECAKLISVLENSWGNYTHNELDAIKFSLAIIRTLPNYFGAKPLNINFLSVYEKVALASEKLGYKNLFRQLNDTAEAGNHKGHYWNITSDTPPYLLSKSFAGIQAYELADFFILNPNVRLNAGLEVKIDSDADGLFDEDEIRFGRDPKNPRSNSVCLDSLDVNPVYRDHCAALTENRNCDEYYDADGDSLNQCEEIVLGTNQFDFDTDDDSIPDYFELIYGFNPLVSDANVDSNGDGTTNLINFSKNLGPNIDLSSLTQQQLTRYRVDAVGYHEEIKNDTTYRVELNEINVENIFRGATQVLPTESGDAANIYLSPLVFLPDSADKLERIPKDVRHNLYGGSDLPTYNKIIALVRLRSLSDPNRYFWSLMKFYSKYVGELEPVKLDLSGFQQMQVIDETR